MKGKNTQPSAPAEAPESRKRLRRAMEVLADFGLVLVAVGLVSPLIGFESPVWFAIFKWVFAIGAVAYTGARIAAAIGRDGSFRVRRLRRLEVWAGISLCVASFFWFYNTGRLHTNMLTFRMFQNTIVFTLVGAMIQIAASWMLHAAMKKDAQ